MTFQGIGGKENVTGVLVCWSLLESSKFLDVSTSNASNTSQTTNREVVEPHPPSSIRA